MKDRELLLEETLQLIKNYKITAYELGNKLNMAVTGVQKIIDGKTKKPQKHTLESIISYIKNTYQRNITCDTLTNDEFLSHLPDPEPRINPTLRDVELSLKKAIENKAKKDFSNAKPNLKTEKLKLVKVIPEKAVMGLLTHFFDSEYVGQLETELIEVDEYFTEDAYKVDSVGESMNDGTARSLLDGDKFLAKDIPRLKWGEKLINGGKNLFYILHSERGNLIKEITSHDLESRELNLHSWNPDKKLYPDFKIKTNECYIIASIEGLLYRKI